MSNPNNSFKGLSPKVEGFLKPNEAVKDFFGKAVYPVARHLFQILPEAVFVFLVLFSILTQNFANGVLAMSLIESLLAFSIIGKGVDYMSGAGGPGQRSEACEAGFPTSVSSYATLSLFRNITNGLSFPSHSIAVLSTLIGYILSSLFAYSNELKELGGGWELRIPIGVTLSFLTLTAFVLFRYIAGCENLGKIIGTLVIGLGIGTALMFQNMNLLGKESVNILGIPTLESRTLNGKPLYVCAPKTE